MHDTHSNDVSSSYLNASSTILPAALIKGNIIDHLRTSIRAETASKSNNHNCDQSVESCESSGGGGAGTKRQRTASFSSAVSDDFDADCDDLESVASHNTTADKHLNDSNCADDLDTAEEKHLSGSLDKSSVEFHTLRKERNRIHAKLTRDRKKLFTSRMQQMIALLERQNNVIRFQLMRTNENLISGSFDNLDNQTASSSSSSSSSSSHSSSSSSSTSMSANSAVNYFGHRFDPFKNHYSRLGSM